MADGYHPADQPGQRPARDRHQPEFPGHGHGTVTAEPAGGPTVDIVSFAVYVATNGGAWTLWQNLSPSSGTPNTATATFTGLSNTIYSFYTTATDNTGNKQVYNPSVEASTYLPDLAPPVTSVNSTTASTNPSTVNAGTDSFTLNATGTDPGGSYLTEFEFYVAIDAQDACRDRRGPGRPAETARATTTPASPTRASPTARRHSYRFYSIGIDGAGHVEAPHPAPNDLVLSPTFNKPSALAVTGLTVENGASERSYVRYLDILFNEQRQPVGRPAHAARRLARLEDPVVQVRPER